MTVRRRAVQLSRRGMLDLLARQSTGVACALLAGACSGAINSSTGALPADGNAPAGDRAKSGSKVALLLPLSGGPQTAAVAKGLQQAAELALFEHNAPTLQLVVKDDKGTEAGAKAAAEDAVKEGAELIIGPLYAKSVTAAAGVARPANVPVIAFSNDARVAGRGVYLLSFLASQEVPRIVEYTVAQGRTRLAALLPEDAFGGLLEPLLRSAVEGSGGTVVHIERYPVEVNGMVDPVQSLRAAIRTAAEEGAPVEALFLPGGADTLPLIGPLLPASEFDGQTIKLIGTGGWDYPNAARERILQGGWFAAPDPRGWREFSERFAKNYKSMPPRLASLAYDAVGIAAALAAGPKGGRFSEAQLTRASGYAGVDGPFRFQASGLSERTLAVLEMQKFGPAVVDGAPSAFGTAQTLAGAPQRGIN